MKYFEVKDITKQEIDEKISIKLQRVNTFEEPVYSAIEYIINDERYVETISTKITDDKFEKTIGNDFVESYSNFNQKNESDFNKEIELLKL